MTDAPASPSAAPPQVRRATARDLDVLAPLFDAYRVFYEQPSDPARARRFLQSRLDAADSVLLLAEGAAGEAPALGFCQLYPTWCSIGTAPMFILSDLFVAEPARRGGAARALMAAARTHARAAGAARLELSTAHTNTRAQALYESLGWRRDEVFRVYGLSLEAA
ncbi:MAG TPA: GNAT family N-acetyltransferase [Burkholderiaceae bacterium]